MSDMEPPSLFDAAPHVTEPDATTARRPGAGSGRPAEPESGASRHAEGLRTTAPQPLADRLRPQSLEDVVGQDHLLAPDAPLGRMLEAGSLSSTILWGPPGCGKTTIARLLAERAGLVFEPLSATFSGVADLRKVFTAATRRRQVGQGTLLFVDEVHRFNRAQQDSFLPYVEDGTVVLVGATTENPSFELNGALLSRCQVLVLRRLEEPALELLLGRAESLTGGPLPLTPAARAALLAMADGDGRYLLGMVEQVLAAAALPGHPASPAAVDGTGEPEPTGRPGSPGSTELDSDEPGTGRAGALDVEALTAVVASRAPLYDKSSEEHYNLISALHKSMRGSDPDAALYWLARMLAGGEDPLYVARRLVRFASEDVGLADPGALTTALAAWEAYERLGSPEGELAVAQAVVYLATAPKSVAVYRGLGRATALARQTGSLAPPAHILNAPTRLMKDLGYGEGYQYDPDAEDGFSGADYMPQALPPRQQRQQLYEPTDHGHERSIRQRLDYWQGLREQRGG
ncbi:replication-associated recombination protein A [Actinomyces wuliandei]|uniref:replication-associated recombination protein A n=1 Tax=Actinomyces wuliandei TaxID=2057743 RepID=UPI0019D47A15|nr:replication-associated recombination protein A [Actinomyces wuliandei]